MTREILDRLEEIQASLRELRKPTDKPFDLLEAAIYLHVSKSHLYQLTSRGLIAHFKPNGKKIYFDKSDLDAYLLRNRVSASAEIDEAAASHIVNRPLSEVLP